MEWRPGRSGESPGEMKQANNGQQKPAPVVGFRPGCRGLKDSFADTSGHQIPGSLFVLLIGFPRGLENSQTLTEALPAGICLMPPTAEGARVHQDHRSIQKRFHQHSSWNIWQQKPQIVSKSCVLDRVSCVLLKWKSSRRLKSSDLVI